MKLLLLPLGWKSEVVEILDRLPARFSLDDVYRFIPHFHERHPENLHVAEKLRQVLQDLRDDGRLDFLSERGTYRNMDPKGPDPVERLPFAAGAVLRRSDIAALLKYENETPLQRGMFKPASGPFRNHLFLFHDEKDNPYGDVIEGDRIRYVGQGREGDQELSGFNRYLAEHLQQSYHVHYFVQPKDRPGEIVYQGEYVLEDFEPTYREAEDRTVLEFRLLPSKQATDPLTDFATAYDEILESTRPPGFEERPRVESVVRRLMRDRAFQVQIVSAYGRRCAICGQPLRRGRLTELQGAHIVPVSEQGRDDPGNGICLCVRHHWAFDNGFFSISDLYAVEWYAGEPDPHGEINAGKAIGLPIEPYPKPHPFYLRYHRNRSRRISGG